MIVVKKIMLATLSKGLSHAHFLASPYLCSTFQKSLLPVLQVPVINPINLTHTHTPVHAAFGVLNGALTPLVTFKESAVSHLHNVVRPDFRLRDCV